MSTQTGRSLPSNENSGFRIKGSGLSIVRFSCSRHNEFGANLASERGGWDLRESRIL